MSISLNDITDNFLFSLKKHELEKLTKRVHAVYKKKYRSNWSREPKYGKMRRWFTKGELRKFFNGFKENEFRFFFFFYTVYCFGLRISEALKIKIGDVFWKQKALCVNRAKGGGQELMPASEDFLFLLHQYCHMFEQEIKGFEWLFFSNNPNNLGEHWSTGPVRKKFREVTKRVGLDRVYGKSSDGRNLYIFTVHSLRHSFGKHLLDLTKDIRLVQELLGHSSVESTEVYTKSSESEMRSAVNELNPF